MGKTVSASTERKILQTIETVNNLQAPALTRLRRRVRTGGAPGSALVYIEITDSTNISTYEGTIYDNPIDRTVIEVDVAVRSLLQSDGTIPDSTSGKGLWCIFVNEVYHVVNPPVAFGA